jgi:hypothetical protein
VRTKRLPVPVTIRLPILLALTALVATVGALAGPSPAAAAKPCWVQLVNDWYDGRIDKTYPVSCYRAAIKNLPEDVRSYSEAREDIERALLAAIRQNEQSGGDELGPSDPVPPEPQEEPAPGETTTGTETGPGGEPDDEGEAAPPGSGSDPDAGGGILEPFKPANADSVPIPLLVLAGLAVLLLAAAGAGFVARRIQARRVRVSALPRGPEGR